jgi:Uncharacterized protein conserved in bacteria
MFDLEDVRKEYLRLDQLCRVDTSKIILGVNARTVRRRGQCTTQSGVPVRVEISEFVFHEPAESFLNTIRHEYAHALAAIRTGRAHGHDAQWRKACQEIGCNGSRTSKASVAQNEKMRQQARYTIACCGCGNEFQRFRKTKFISLLETGQKHSYRCVHCNSEDFKLK